MWRLLPAPQEAKEAADAEAAAAAEAEKKRQEERVTRNWMLACFALFRSCQQFEPLCCN